MKALEVAALKTVGDLIAVLQTFPPALAMHVNGQSIVSVDEGPRGLSLMDFQHSAMSHFVSRTALQEE